MKEKTFFIVFEGLSFGIKIKGITKLSNHPQTSTTTHDYP